EHGLGLIHPARPVGAAIPAAVRLLQREQLCAPALVSDAGALGRNHIRGRAHEVAQHLPSDRRIRFEKPVAQLVGEAHGVRLRLTWDTTLTASRWARS